MILSTKEIHKLNEYPLSTFLQLSSTVIGFKVLDFLDEQPVSFKVQEKQIELPLCNIEFVDCLGILSCYLIRVPGFHIQVHDKYTKIRRFEAINNVLYKGTNFVYQDKYLNVIHSDEGASLISPSKLHRIIKPEMVRKSALNGGN